MYFRFAEQGIICILLLVTCSALWKDCTLSTADICFAFQYMIKNVKRWIFELGRFPPLADFPECSGIDRLHLSEQERALPSIDWVAA